MENEAFRIVLAVLFVTVVTVAAVALARWWRHRREVHKRQEGEDRSER